MRKKLAFILVFTVNLLSAQDSISLLKNWELTLTSGFTWTTDNFNNIYLAEKDILKKYAENGKQLFTQSLKTFGQIDEIDAKNPMKIMLFSEQQQFVFLLDNTLSKQNEINLDKFDLNYATHIAASIQADKFWAFDQQNSTINLIATKQEQSIKLANLAGLLEINKVTQLMENDEALVIVDKEKGVFLFDLYGTLINQISITNYKWVEYSTKYLYVLKNDDSLEIINLDNMQTTPLSLPISEIKKFKISQNYLFLQSKDKLFNYQIKIF